MVTLGPPGTGKTTRLLADLDREIQRGTPPERIAVVTFTRAARREVQERLARQGISPDETPWVRTIHSTAYRLLGLTRDCVLSGEAWAEFAKSHGYALTGGHQRTAEDDPTALPARTVDDELRRAYEWGRNRRLAGDQVLARWRGPRLDARRFRRYQRQFEDFLRAERLLDFAGMVEEAVALGLRPPVDVVFIDEAQDLSPLQILACEHWFADCEWVYVYGDEDQAIYGFQGAEPAWLIGLSKARPPRILEQSYRVPEAAHRLGMRIIGANRERIPKAFRPAPRPGRLEQVRLEELPDFLATGEETMVLARNRFSLRPVAERLMDVGVPFRGEGPGISSPLAKADLGRAAELVRRIRHSADVESVPAADLVCLLRFVPSGRLAPRGVKKRVQEEAELGTRFGWSEVVTELGLETLVEEIAGRGMSALSKLAEADRTYLERLLRRHGRIPQPQVTLTTIHAAKGRQAKRVVLLPGMSKATYAEYRQGGQQGFEAENRVFYVGVTRTSDSLVLVRPEGRRHYDFPGVAA